MPEITVEANGTGPELQIPHAHGAFLLTLGIVEAIEQASLLVSVFGSVDGNQWSETPLLEWPQKFYPGVSSLYLPETSENTIQFVRVQWKTNRWGRGSKVARFRFYVFAEELTA